MDKLIEKAAVLIEALPYIQNFRTETIVVKFGGSAMEVRGHYDGTLTDVVFMECVGMRPVVVHGGGKAISRRMTEAGLEARFVQGLRVTDAAAIDVVRDVLNNEVNPGIVETIKAKGGKAAAIYGEEILRVKKHVGIDEESGEPIDWGFVGDVESVDIAPVQAAIEADVIPVITPLGRDADGNVYNVNADVAAAVVAQALKARKLAFLSDVAGLLRDENDPESVISTLKIADVEMLIRDRVIKSGMLPKINGGVRALQAGVKKIHIIDGRAAHSLLLEIFTDKGVGTEIIHE